MEFLSTEIIKLIADATGTDYKHTQETLKMMTSGDTIPFIARYRKERTGGMDEVKIEQIYKLKDKYTELAKRKIFILESINSQGKLTESLKEKINLTYDSTVLEDIYLPFKKNKKTKADIAREAGLEPLAKTIMSQRAQDPFFEARAFLNMTILSEEEAIVGAKNIIAEWIALDQHNREYLRVVMRKKGILSSKVNSKKKEMASKYRDYFDFQEPIFRCPSHRFLAMTRGENEGFLKLSIKIDDGAFIDYLNKKYVKSYNESANIIQEAIEDGYERLLFPSVETQVFNEFKEKADDEAIHVFGENARQLLLAPPLGQKRVMAIDPGFRTGCKVVCIDENANLVHHTTIYPNEPQRQTDESQYKLQTLVAQYQIQAIAIGNGTASRETKLFIDAIRWHEPVEIYVVSENGASIYSASAVAREEFPDHDVTIRGAISIGRRLMDPLAELVKIDPKSIGVGQYQHDVNQNKLKEHLDLVVASCVNKVGVNLNTASPHLLNYISGLGPTLAKNIVDYRKNNGEFRSIDELNKVPRLGKKAFEQAAGFLRIQNGDNLLDNTGVHPESYPIVFKMAKKLGVSLDKLLLDKHLQSQINPEEFITDLVGLPTIKDIMVELSKPGVDPRGKSKQFSFDDTVKSIDDLQTGMVLPGIITNLTDFGAFVDIGVKQDGLIHKSQIARKYVAKPSDFLKLGQEVRVQIMEVDNERGRINLSMLLQNTETEQ